MAMGDEDLASGLFFQDFGENIQFAGATASGIVDGPSKDAVFDRASVSDVEYRIEMSACAFDPMPKAQDRLIVLTGRYKGGYQIRSVGPIGDGATVEIKLRKL